MEDERAMEIAAIRSVLEQVMPVHTIDRREMSIIDLLTQARPPIFDSRSKAKRAVRAGSIRLIEIRKVKDEG